MDVTIPKTVGDSTLTRASSATYYNSAGVLTYAGNNVLRVNYNPANLAAAPEVLLEGLKSSTSNASGGFPGEGFYNFTKTNSVVYLNSAVAPDGTRTSALITETSASGAHSVSRHGIPSLLDTPNTLSVYVKAKERDSFVLRTSEVGADQSTLFNLSTLTTSSIGATPSAHVASIVPINGGWYRCIVRNVIAVAPTITVSLYNGSESYIGDGRSGMYFWGIQLENNIESSYIPSVQTFVSGANPGAYYNSTGKLVFASGTARQNYTPSNLAIPAKLLVENTATNLLLQSNQFATSPWVATDAVVSGTGQADPTPTNSAGYKLSDNGTLFGNYAQTVTVPSDTLMRVFSVYVLKTSGATIFPGFEVTASSTVSIGFNTNTGVGYPTVFSGVVDYFSVESLPTHWRISIGVYNNGATSYIVRIYPGVGDSTAISTGSWNAAAVGSVTVYGAQLETNLTETSYIATTTTQVTRSADVVTITEGYRQPDVSPFGLIYTNVTENDFPVYNPLTTYGIAVGGTNSVIYNHVKYASLQASNTGHQPDISPTWWSVIGPTNAYAMFDGQVGTQTVGTVGGSIIVYVKIGALTSLNFLNMSVDSLAVTVYSDYTSTYTNTIDLTGGITGVPVTDYTISGLTPHADAYVKVVFSSTTTAPAIGNFVVGTNYFVGSTETSPTIGITDYSIKNVDAFGNPTLTVRGYAKRMNTKQLLEDADVDTIARLMAQVRAKACVWNANTTFADRTSNKKTSLIVYGYYKDWEIDVAYSTKSYLTAQIEGLI